MDEAGVIAICGNARLFRAFASGVWIHAPHSVGNAGRCRPNLLQAANVGRKHLIYPL